MAQTQTRDDELLLAQLACAKLPKLLQGALSVGLPALVTRAPEPRAFFRDCFRRINAFAVVLQSACWPTGNVAQNTAQTIALRAKSARLLAQLDDLELQLLAAVDAPDPAAAVAPARRTADAVFDAVADFATLIRLDGDPTVRPRAVSFQVFDALPALRQPPAAAAM